MAPSISRAAGSPDISLDKSADTEVLYGEDSNVTLEASNPAGQPVGYNLSFRDVLPVGVTYVPGSAPAVAGEPEIVNDEPSTGQTTLIWSNLTDLTANSSFSFSFKVSHTQTQYDVSQTYTNNAGAYINCSPRYVPDFDDTGAPVQGGQDPDCANDDPDQSYTGSATDGATTEIKAIKLSKDEPSPEGELLRGVHNHQTVYTLTVENNFVNPDNGLRVEDYLPAGLEFLGCGGVDNTTDAPTNPGSEDEYAGSGPINPGNEPGGTWTDDCYAPDTVETVTDPPGLPAGVYTHVVWNDLTDLTPGDVFEVKYAAAIPIRENTADWNGAAAGQGTAPGTGGAQIANLDNNSGPETQDEQALTNYASASATYQGNNGPIAASDDADLTRTAEDIRLLKSVDDDTLASGAISEWSLQIDTSEYRYVNNIVVSDTLGDGYCPLDASANLEATPPPASTECNPVSGEEPSADYTSAVEQADGTWLLTWNQNTIPALNRILPSSSYTITFPTMTREHYQENFTDAGPVLARDVGHNDVSLTGDDFIICAPGDPTVCAPGSPDKIDADEADGTEDIDESSASQESVLPLIDKKVSPSLNSADCSVLNDYVDDPAPLGRPGDTVCWQLTMNFPENLNSGSVKVEDFIPPGTTYVPGSTDTTANNTTIITSDDAPEPDTDDLHLTWPLDDGEGTVIPEQTFQVAFAVRVERNLATTDGDITANLMKAVLSNTAGTTFPLRDEASFQLSQPEIDLVKGVRDIDGIPNNGRGPNVDGGTVSGGDDVTYRVDVSNDGSVDADQTEVWDVLPAEIDCTMVSAITDGGTCNATENRIEWTGLTVPAGDSLTLTYTVAIPDGLSAGDTLVNTAGVRQFESPSGSGPYVTIPTDNIDPTQDENANAPEAGDPSNVEVEGVELVKTRTTEIDEPGNAAANQATIGEEVTYTVTATIPEGTSLYGADTALVDSLGSRQTLVAGSASGTIDTGSGAAALPSAGVDLVEDLPGNAVDVEFPDPFDNPNGSGDDVVTFTFTVKVDDDFPGNQAQGTATQYTLPNTATLNWHNLGGDELSESGSVDTTIVEPDVSIEKTSDTTGLLTPGQVIEFTLATANGNGARVSTAHDSQVVDTLPVGLDPVNGATLVADGGTVNPDGGIWDEIARTITWPSYTLNPGGTRDLVYSARVSDEALGSGQLRNTAGIVTTSLPDGPDDDGERDSTTEAPGYEDGAELVGELISAGIDKSGDPGSATIGEQITHTLTVTIPSGIGQYDTTVIDDVPDGLVFESYLSATCVSGCTGGNSDIAPDSLTPVANGDGQRIGWYFGDLDPIQAVRTVELKYHTHVGSDYNAGGTVVDGDTVTNNADLLFDTTDKITTDPTEPPDPEDFDEIRETDDDTAVVEPHVVLDKNVSGDPDGDDARDTQPGDSYTYSVIVTNDGSAPAYDVAVTDQPDAELTNVVIGTGPDWNVTDAWTEADPDIAWTIPGPIAPGGSVTLTYTADLIGSPNLSNEQEVINTADVPDYFGVPDEIRELPENEEVEYREYDEVDPDTVTLTVRVPDLDLDKTTGLSNFPDEGPAKIENAFPWRIVITNPNDPSLLRAVDLDDTLPPNWTYLAGSAQITGTGSLSPGGQIEPTITEGETGDVLSWTDIADLDGGDTVIVEFQATPDVGAAITPGVGEIHLNSAAAEGEDTSGSTESAEGPYTDEDDATAILDRPEVDLTITKVADDPEPVAGTDTTWTIDVTNNGPETSPDVLIADVLPEGLTYVSAVPDQGTCGEVPAGTVACELGSMASGETVSIKLTTNVGADQAGNTLTNPATVTDPTVDETDTENNDDSDEITPSAEANLSIQKERVGDLIVGQQGHYRLTVSNDGPSVAEDAVVTDPLPDKLGYVSAAASSGSCSATEGVVECEVGDIAPGQIVTVDLTVDVIKGGSTTNTGEVTTITPETDPGDNTDETTDPAGNADLTITKVAPDALVEGTEGEYTLQVSNVSQMASGGTVTVTDPVPASLTPVGAFGTGWTCDIAGQLVTCTREDSLGAGQAFPVITVRVNAVAGGGFSLVKNVATVNLDGDSNPDNNTDEVETPRGNQQQIDENVIRNTCLNGSLKLTPTFTWVGEKTKVTVLVRKANGSAAARVPVQLTGNGKAGASKKAKTATTNRKGRAQFTVTGRASAARWTAKVKECEIKAPLPVRKQTTCSAISVNPRSVAVGELTRLQVRLRSPRGGALSGVKVIVRGQGTSDSARTNAKGKATLRVNPRAAGKLIVTAPNATSCRYELGASGVASGNQLTG